MAAIRSKVTAQGQISVPAAVRRKLGIGPGSVLEWEEDGDRMIVRRAGKYTFDDIHRALFGNRKPKPHTVEEMKESIRRAHAASSCAPLTPMSSCVLIAQDDATQVAAASQFIGQGVWVSVLVLAETVWVLESGYRI